MVGCGGSELSEALFKYIEQGRGKQRDFVAVLQSTRRRAADSATRRVRVPPIVVSALQEELAISIEAFGTVLSYKTGLTRWFSEHQGDYQFGADSGLMTRASWAGMYVWANAELGDSERILRKVYSMLDVPMSSHFRLVMVTPSGQEWERRFRRVGARPRMRHRVLAELSRGGNVAHIHLLQSEAAERVTPINWGRLSRRITDMNGVVWLAGAGMPGGSNRCEMMCNRVLGCLGGDPVGVGVGQLYWFQHWITTARSAHSPCEGAPADVVAATCAQHIFDRYAGMLGAHPAGLRGLVAWLLRPVSMDRVADIVASMRLRALCGAFRTYNVARSLLRDWICDVATAETLRAVLGSETANDQVLDRPHGGHGYNMVLRDRSALRAANQRARSQQGFPMVLYTDEESLAGVSLGDLRQETLLMLDMTDT